MMHLLKQLIKMQKIFPNIKFVIVSSNDNAEELRLLYSSCFIGLHLTDNYHVLSDGRVQELGLCGIKCVHNSNLPNALKWESEQDIVNHIKTEYEKIGDNIALRKVAQDVHNYLNTEPDWIRTKFYDGVVVKKPAMVLEKPVMVLEKPVMVLEKPVMVLEKPVMVLEKPVVVLEKPVVVLEKPKEILEKPEVLVIESRVPSPHWDTGDYSVTVIMPVYGEKSEYLVSAIDGYLRQRNIKLQLVISTIEDDPCIEYIENNWAYKIKKGLIKFCISDKNSHPGYGYHGFYYQIHQGFKFVRTRWCTVASGNNLVSDTKLYLEIQACLDSKKLISYSDESTGSFLSRSSNYSYNAHLTANFVPNCALVDSHIMISMMPFDMQYQKYAFWDLWLRIYQKYGNVFEHLPKNTFTRRNHCNALQDNQVSDIFYCELIIKNHQYK